MRPRRSGRTLRLDLDLHRFRSFCRELPWVLIGRRIRCLGLQVRWVLIRRLPLRWGLRMRRELRIRSCEDMYGRLLRWSRHSSLATLVHRVEVHVVILHALRVESRCPMSVASLTLQPPLE